MSPRKYARSDGVGGLEDQRSVASFDEMRRSGKPDRPGPDHSDGQHRPFGIFY